MATREEKMEAFGQLLDILDELRVKSHGIVNRQTRASARIQSRKPMNYARP